MATKEKRPRVYRIYSDNTQLTDTEQDISALKLKMNSIAEPFVATKSYNAGGYVWYNNVLYVFTADHAAGSWTGSDAEQVILTEEMTDQITELKSEITATGSILNSIGKEEDFSWFSLEYDGKYMSTTNTEESNAKLSHTDYILIPQNAVKIVTSNKTSNTSGSSVSAIGPNLLFYDTNKTFLNYANKSASHGDIVEFDIPNGAVYVKANQPSKSAGAGIHLLKFIYKEDGFIGGYSGTFTAASQGLKTGIIMKANTTYVIRWYGLHNEGNRNVYGFGATSNLKVFYPFTEEVTFTNGDADRELVVYNGSNGLGDVNIKVFLPDSVALKAEYEPKHYRVSKNANNADYTSLTQCLKDLKDDNSPKIIEIWEGEYDIYQEYVDASIPVYTGDDPALDYFDYCVWIPKNTHIIGKGIVRLKWMPTLAENPEITWKQCQAVSPVNVAGSMTLENVEIHCKNGRYCIHNDALGKPEYTGAIQKYINVKCYKYENEIQDGKRLGTSNTIGFGIDRAMHHIYENCTFINYNEARTFYGHSRGSSGSTSLTELHSPSITVNNCIIQSVGSNAVKLGNSTERPIQIRVLFSNCFISGRFDVINENDSDTAVRNAFDVTLLNCGDVSMYVQDSNNEYQPQAYLTNLTMLAT